MKDKYRHEFKYMVTEAQLSVLAARLSGIMAVDSHAGPDGRYIISSIYFDDYKNTGFFENENGTDPREKFRIRIYNHSDARISLENKKKVCGMTQKNACLITKEELAGIMGWEGTLPVKESPVWNKFADQYNTRLLRPKVIVDYERQVYICKQGNVRITFDRNISSSEDYEHFFENSMAKRPIMPAGKHILEVKYDEYLPDYIYKALEIQGLQRTMFSKYYLCRKYHM